MSAARTRTENARAFLLARGADRIAHPGGSLFEHLVRTAALLEAWGAREELQLAGLCHAVYGTDEFNEALAAPSDREPLRSVIGSAAERIVYAYAACDRDASYADLVCGGSALRNRLGGMVYELDERSMSDFIELTFANEIDVMRHSPELRQRFGRGLADLFESLSGRAGPRARAAFESEFAGLRT